MSPDSQFKQHYALNVYKVHKIEIFKMTALDLGIDLFFNV